MLKNLKWLQQVPKKMPFKVGSLVFLQKTSCFHPGNSKLFCIFLLFRIYGAFLSHGGNPPVIIHSDGIFPNENHPCLGFSYGFPMGFLFGVPPQRFIRGRVIPHKNHHPIDLPTISPKNVRPGARRQVSGGSSQRWGATDLVVPARRRFAGVRRWILTNLWGLRSGEDCEMR